MERFSAREIVLRYSAGPRWTATALIARTGIAEKLDDDLRIDPPPEAVIHTEFLHRFNPLKFRQTTTA